MQDLITVESSFGKVPFERFNFSGGEVHVRLLHYPSRGVFLEDVTITAHLVSSDAIFELLLVTNALRRVADQGLRLRVPYLPYARQDRVCVPGEPLSLRVICDILNAQNYASVEVWDVHSDVGLALLDRVCNIPSCELICRHSVFWPNTILVSPDTGAARKVADGAKALKLPMIRADKVRDPRTGEITDTVVHSGPVGNSDFLIVDDICDGGKTFVELAKKLRPLTTGKILLYVTHGIFSKGFEVFDGLIDHIYCANPFPNVPLSPLLTKI